jgi:hypothetical protein
MFRALCRSSSGILTVFEPLVYKYLWGPPVLPSEWEHVSGIINSVTELHRVGDLLLGKI